MLITNHVLSGALIGALIRRPVPAFALGVASHFALDATPHWGRWSTRRRFLQVAVPDGLTGLAVIGTFAALSPPQRRLAVLAGMAGAALPDIDKPSRLWFGRSPWPAAVNRFHSGIQKEGPEHFGREMVAMSVFAAASVAAVTAGRRRANAS